MITLLVGFSLGVLCVAVAARHPAMQSTVARALSFGSAPSPASATFGVLSDDDLNQLRRDAPEIAAAIAQPAAVDLRDVPGEIKHEDFEGVDKDDHDAVREKAFKLVRDYDVAEIIAVLHSWNPARQRYGEAPGEDYYERSFERALKRYKFSGTIERQRRVEWRVDAGDARAGVPDVILRGRVLVELKAELTQAGQSDRALGQMLRYLFAWKTKGPSVLVVCGEVPPAIRSLLRYYLKLWRETLGLPITVYFKREEGHRTSAADFPEPAS